MAIVRFFTLNANGVKNLKSANRHELPGVSIPSALKWASESLAISPELCKGIFIVEVANDSPKG